MRGFTENSLTATKYAVLNTEYRYLLSNTIYAHSVIDFASLENKINSQNESLYGFGLGFGILTKAGLLKFNFANGKVENQQFKFSNSKIHLSLTALF
ncbi:BamA/TamA family outer membrane protein [Lacinutrix neustonica]|uniref:BamA/TamA family outer membrane protein n=1 Tax=Lacinutrix neustonica TaxID=2980107 RepID=A0A9E8MZR9_9FLAO|nr:BamA/TamA family outer membrane protein [Lacinutrix neustonica]WAC03864.1 BamA/TamA family outer membrane protein [Lacinutrix neustonica]